MTENSLETTQLPTRPKQAGGCHKVGRVWKLAWQMQSTSPLLRTSGSDPINSIVRLPSSNIRVPTKVVQVRLLGFTFWWRPCPCVRRHIDDRRQPAILRRRRHCDARSLDLNSCWWNILRTDMVFCLLRRTTETLRCFRLPGWGSPAVDKSHRLNSRERVCRSDRWCSRSTTVWVRWWKKNC